VSNIIGGIRIFSADIHQSNPPLLGTITNGTTRPEGVWIDRNGTLYVANAEQYPRNASLAEYKQGATSPFRTITSGLYAPAAVAVGDDGTVYVNSVDGNTTGKVVEYARGKLKPKRTVTLPDPGYSLTPGGLAFDQNGNLLAATLLNSTTVHVFKIAPGSSHVIDLGLQGVGGPAIGVDGAGNLYTAGLYLVAVYPPGAISPSRTFPLNFYANGLAVAHNGTLYVVGNLTVAEFAPGASSPTNYIDTDYGETGTFDAALGAQW
jgi:sugar lactone lactonase YvrE